LSIGVFLKKVNKTSFVNIHFVQEKLIMNFFTACYGIVTVPSGNWYCRKCESPDRAKSVCIKIVIFILFYWGKLYSSYTGHQSFYNGLLKSKTI
jgi:hypothetical protein